MMADLNWSDAQWQKVNDAVNEAFGKASVASAFLPMYGPLAGSSETVRNERLKQKEGTESTPLTISLDKDHAAVNLNLVTVTVNVELSGEQVADESLSNALLAFRRAANILAQEEDRIVFEGTDGTKATTLAKTVGRQKGLADPTMKFESLGAEQGPELGRDLVKQIVKAIHKLEDKSNPSPFACVLGNRLFEAAYDPADSLVLPADRILPLLKGGPLLRCGKMDESKGIVVSLAGNAIDIVVGTPPTVQFLQRTIDAKFVFRVYERFALRLRDKENLPVAGFKLPATEGNKKRDA
jgi:uncharacterized linocin/CFP29 family protein